MKKTNEDKFVGDSRSLDRPAWSIADGWEAYKHKRACGRPPIMNYYVRSRGHE